MRRSLDEPEALAVDLKCAHGADASEEARLRGESIGRCQEGHVVLLYEQSFVRTYCTYGSSRCDSMRSVRR